MVWCGLDIIQNTHMKIINHNKGNYTFVSPSDSSVMYGTIEMNQEEFENAIAFLKKRYGIAKRYCHTYVRDSLAHVFTWTLKHYPQNGRISLGVCATELLFKHFDLPRYKKQNYVIIIK